MRVLARLASFTVSAFFLSACGGAADPGQGGGGAAPTASTSTDATTSVSTGIGGGANIGEPSHVFPAPHPKAPTVTLAGGGQVLATPKVFPVFFSGDDATTVSDLKDFYAKLGPSSYWSAAVGEYGVGALTSTAPIKLSETAPSTLTFGDIDAWLTAKLDADDPAFAGLDDNSIIALNYPVGVTVDLGGSLSCVGFGGYHENVFLNSAHGNKAVAYLVIPRCTAAPWTQLETTTAAVAHELVEASTDPLPLLSTAYDSLDADHAYWAEALGGSEIADMCSGTRDSYRKDAALGFFVPRAWSNAAAAADHDPCVPAVNGEAYFNSAPVLDDFIQYQPLVGQPVAVKGVHIPVGQTKTVEIDLFSDAEVAPWNVKAIDVGTLFGQPAALQFTFDAQSGQNGQKLHLDIHATKATAAKYEVFMLVSELAGRQHVWVGLVGN